MSHSAFCLNDAAAKCPDNRVQTDAFFESDQKASNAFLRTIVAAGGGVAPVSTFDSVMNSRRCMVTPELRRRHCISSNGYFEGPEFGIKIFAAVKTVYRLTKRVLDFVRLREGVFAKARNVLDTSNSVRGLDCYETNRAGNRFGTAHVLTPLARPNKNCGIYVRHVNILRS